MKPAVVLAMKDAAEARLYAHARMAVALALATREYDPASREAKALAFAARQEAVRARASSSTTSLATTLADEAEHVVAHVAKVSLPDWRQIVAVIVGNTLLELWGVEVLS